MGVEHKLYTVKKYGAVEENGWCWADVVAVADVGKCNYLLPLLKNKPATDSYIFSDDGNTKIYEDMYGDPLSELTPSEAVEILEKAAEELAADGFKYDRLNIALAMLRAAKKEQGLTVLHYAY